MSTNVNEQVEHYNPQLVFPVQDSTFEEEKVTKKGGDTRIILLILCFLFIIAGLLISYIARIDDTIFNFQRWNATDTWWGESAFSFYVTPLLIIMLCGMVIALIITISSYLISKKHTIMMWIGSGLVLISMGLTILVVCLKDDSLQDKAHDKTINRYSQENLTSSLGGTIWRDEANKIEIRFSYDGETAKTIIDGKEGNYERYGITRRETIDEEYGDVTYFECIILEKGILVLRESCVSYQQALYIPRTTTLDGEEILLIELRENQVGEECCIFFLAGTGVLTPYKFIKDKVWMKFGKSTK